MKRILATALAAAVLLTACTKTGESGGRNGWTVPHELRYATAEDINTLNPHFGTAATINLMSQMTMAYLIRWDHHNLPYGELATEVPTKANGGVSADGLTITYHLRKNAKWSDGVPFTADDVLFSIDVVLNPKNNETSTTGWNFITKKSAPDKYTVVLKLSKPYSPFVETFFSTGGANPCLLPKHLLAKYPDINNVPYNALPVGIGPFKYLRWDRSQRVEMVRDPLYWRGRAKLDKVTFEIVPDRNTVLSQMQAHELDLWWPVPGAYFDRVKNVPGVKYLRQPSYYYNHYDFNIQRPRVSDPVVRRALRLALDRTTLRNKIGHGVGIIQDVPAPNTAPYFDKDIKNIPTDIPAANAMLDKDGWVRGPGGIRSKNGVVLNLDLATSTGTADVDQQIELIRGWWKQIGVGINVVRYPSQQMFAPAQQGGVVYSNKWDLVFFAWGVDPIGDYSSIYGCQSFPPNGQNDLRWCDKKAQAAMDAVYRDYDQGQRNTDLRGLFEAFVDQAPSIVSTLREDVYAYNSDLKNFNPNGVSPFDDMMNVDI